MSGIVNKVKDKLDSGSSSGGLQHGSKLPNVGLLKENSPTDASLDLSQLHGRNILVGAPGAFSPQCTDQVPGYLENAEKFAAKGVQGIYVVVVNDHFTVAAWKEKMGAAKAPLVHFVADDQGKFTKAAGMDFDAVAFFGNNRSQRYAAVIEDGVVKQIFVEKAPTDITVSSATNLLEALG